MNNLERFDTFTPVFSTPAHDLSPVTTKEELAREQLKNSLAQAAFWLGVADAWSQEVPKDTQFETDLADAMHYTGMSQLRLMD